MPVTQTPILTVSQLNNQVRQLLEETFGVVSISGEISNWVRASSGHCYFSLKDPEAQVRCALFRGRANQLRFKPDNGQAVVLHGQVSLYPNRGDYQLIVSHMEPAGMGQLAILFAKLKKKLQAAGLFDNEHKQPIPEMPKRIGIISSPTGAALQDILKVLRRRFPLAPVNVYPSLVQGEQAAKNLNQALKQAIADNSCDVLIITRGGGSMEDLWAFNDEQLAHNIFSCPIPIVSAIGHEIDFTIADFVADLRAATPSAAAELVVPEQQTYYDELAGQLAYLEQLLTQLINNKQHQLQNLQARLKHPKQLLENQMQRLDYLQLRQQQAIQRHLEHAKNRLNTLSNTLHAYPWQQELAMHHTKIKHKHQRLTQQIKATQIHKKNHLQNFASKLDQLSPLATLARGYSIISIEDSKSNTVTITAADQVKTGQIVTGRLHSGTLKLKVTDKNNAK